MTMKILTLRVPTWMFSSLCKQAGEAGLTVSAHARRLIEREHDIESLAHLRDELIKKIEAFMPTYSPKTEVEMTEILLLLRELAADRNPQIIQRVRGKLQQLQE